MNALSHDPRQRGFSLIEVLVAIVILSTGLLSLAMLQQSLIRSSAEAKSQSLALSVARQKIDLLMAAQEFGGADSGCVSPTAWTSSSNPSCYRMITDETYTVDGDPTVTGTQSLGGVDYTMTTTVTRYVYNTSTDLYESASDTALDSALETSPETLLPGKEFKRIVATVTWTDATAVKQQVSLEDAMSGLVPRDSISLLVARKGVLPRKAESIINNPGATAGVIPIAVGNGSSTAASNPTPILLGSNSDTYVSETRFDVYTYIPLDETTALAQSRVETAVVGCRCDTTQASTTEEPLRPTYWNGLRYEIPVTANYVGLTTASPTKNYPLAGPATGGDEQSEQCRVCCRDHWDPSGNDANGDPRAAVALYSPRRSSHTHYVVDPITGARTLLSGDGAYNEVCRMIRVDGIFRVSADMENDYFALLEARNTGVSSFAPSTDVADDYADMVKKYLKARYYPDPEPDQLYNSLSTSSPAGPDPYSNTYVQGTRTLADSTTRTYDLNLPSTYYLALTNDAKWLHARGLYIDYLGPEAIAKIDQVKADCPTQPATDDCVLPYLPFTSINLSELAAWNDAAIIPDPAGTGEILSVMNNGFDTASGDVTYTETGTGSSGTYELDFTSAVNSGIVAGMSASGTNVPDNAIVTSVSNSGRKVFLDLTLTGTVNGTITFQGSPVRGRATPGSSPGDGDASFARAKASKFNAAVALQYPMNDDEDSYASEMTDEQRFDMASGGAPPDPTAGTFKVTGFSGYSVDSTHPKVAWGQGSGTPSVANSCTLDLATKTFTCVATSGLGGEMGILLADYNTSVTKTDTLSLNTCYYKSGTSYLIVPSTVTTTSSVSRPYVNNYSVTAATSSGIVLGGTSGSGSPPYTVSSDQTTSETTEIHFNPIEKDLINSPATLFDTITLTLTQEASPNDQVPAAFVCCLAKKTGSTYSFDSVTYAPDVCPFTP